MTVTAVEITRRPAPASTTPVLAGRAAEPTNIVVVADVEVLTHTNQPGCGDDNPYR